jgi:hypothetical protein
MEHIADFELAIDSLETRTWPWGPWKGQPIIRQPYREVAKFSAQLRRYFELFGRERVHVVLYDDLRQYPGKTFREVLKFLNLFPDHGCDFAPHNSNRRVRNMKLQGWLRDPSPALRNAAHALLPARMRRTLGQTLRGLNIKHEPRKALTAALRQRLQGECAPDIRELGTLLSMDLSSWTETASLPPRESSTSLAAAQPD